MRIYLKLTPNTKTVPFNYQQMLVGAFHKWLGQNELHDDISLYSLSWLTHGERTKNGFNFPNGSTFFVSSYRDELLADLINGIQKGQNINWGMKVNEIIIQRTPNLGNKQYFLAQSPIHIKRTDRETGNIDYYFPKDKVANMYLTETLQNKLKKAGIKGTATVKFDLDYKNPKIKKIDFNKIGIKGTLCPVIVEGDPRAVAFAWEVGIGNSTGIGFGALK